VDEMSCLPTMNHVIKKSTYEWEVLFPSNKSYVKMLARIPLQTINHVVKEGTYGCDVMFGTSTKADDGYTATTSRQRPVLLRCK